MELLSILLQQKPGQGGGIGPTILMFGLIIAVFYFFMIRPQQKKAKEAKKFYETLQKGTRIVTIGGIHGKVEEIRDTTLIISVEDGTRIKIEKRAVSPDNSLMGNEQQPQKKV